MSEATCRRQPAQLPTRRRARPVFNKSRRWPRPTASDLARPELATPSAEGALVTELLELQRDAGNAAVVELLQRAPDPTPSPPSPPPAPNPLDDLRIKWIDEMPDQIKSGIDGAAEKVEARYKALEDSLAKQKAAADALKTDADKQEANTKIAVGPEAKDKDKLDKLYGKSWALKRIAFMDYLGCQLGGDAGVERYYRSLVEFQSKLLVHPEAARRLEKVQEELAKEKIPMPETTVGFGLRGRHLHGKVESESPGMMTHSLGVAIDWEAYKNVHIKDESLMALFAAVTGHSHNIQMPAGGIKAIEALGEKSMGNKLTANQEKLVADNGDAMIEKIGEEFDRLSADSDKFRDSLGTDKVDKDAVMALHKELKPYGQEIRNIEEEIQQNGSTKGRQERLAKAREAGQSKMAENKDKLEKLFKPWLDALKTAAAAKRQEAAPILTGSNVKDAKLEQVMTNEGLKWRSGVVAAGTSDIKKDLTALDKSAGASVGKLQSVGTAIAGARAYLEKSGKEDEKTEWTNKLAALEARASTAVGRATGVRTESLVLRGSAPANAAAAPTSKPRKPRWAKEPAAWEAEISKQEAAVTTAETSLKDATGKAKPEALTAAYTLRDDRAAHEAIRQHVSAENFKKLQDLKGQLWNIENAADRLLTDASFMFAGGSVRNPGVAQITGPLEENESGQHADIGGGGIFGTSQSAKDAAAKIAATGKGSLPAKAGFSKRFFQVMVKYGFEPAATWHTADSMHFQLAGLANSIVPTKECLEPPAGAEKDAKTDKEKEAIEKRRTDAAAARARGEEYSKGAEASKTAWDTAHPKTK